jgi:hypothetical protein
MVHYKVSIDLCQGLPDGGNAFCGVSILTAGERFHYLGETTRPSYLRPKVDCPDCIRMYDAVVNDFLGSKNP